MASGGVEYPSILQCITIVNRLGHPVCNNRGKFTLVKLHPVKKDVVT
jgi:hypothetical protein